MKWTYLFLVVVGVALSSTRAQSQDGSTGTPPDTIQVFLDVKPGSCPNPVNFRSNGKLPVAIMGTADLDVTQIDPTSLMIEGSATPTRSSIEDVAAPFSGDAVSVPVGFTTDLTCTDCQETEPDGIDDLTLKFEIRDVRKAIRDVEDDDHPGDAHGHDADDDDDDGNDDGDDDDDDDNAGPGGGGNGKGNGGSENGKGNGGGPGRGKPATKEAYLLTLTGNLLDGTPIKGVDVVCLKRDKPDFDDDDEVTFGDFVSFAQQFGRKKHQVEYDERFDLNEDGEVNFADLLTFVSYFTGGPSASKPAVPASGDIVDSPLSISSVPVDGSDRITVLVQVDEADVTGFELSVNYDPALLEPINAVRTSGSVFGESGEVLALQTTPTEGSMILSDIYRAAETSDGGTSLARITFRTLDDARTPWIEISKALLSDASGAIHSVAGARLNDVHGIPSDFALGHNYPNPFNPTTTIDYQVPESGDVSLVVYNTLGQEVRRLVQERVEAGFHRVVWDGRDARGRTVSSGIYLVRMQGRDFRQVRKMLMLK